MKTERVVYKRLSADKRVEATKVKQGTGVILKRIESTKVSTTKDSQHDSSSQ